MVNKRLSTRYYSSQQESEIAKAMGGKPTPNSGARPYAKGDVSSNRLSYIEDENGEKQLIEKEDFLFEAKTCMTPKQSFAIKKQWLTTIKEEAFQAGKVNYALAFSFGPKQENYYIISEEKFKQLFGDE